MQRNQKISAGGLLAALQVFLNAMVIKQGFISNPDWHWLLIITIPLLIFSLMLIPRERRNITD